MPKLKTIVAKVSAVVSQIALVVPQVALVVPQIAAIVFHLAVLRGTGMARRSRAGAMRPARMRPSDAAAVCSAMAATAGKNAAGPNRQRDNQTRHCKVTKHTCLGVRKEWSNRNERCRPFNHTSRNGMNSVLQYRRRNGCR